MKKLTRFISLFAAAILCFATLAFAGCKDEADCYTFIVKYENGTAAENLTVQLCKGDTYCDSKMATTDADGKAELTHTNGADEYDIHVWSADMTVQYEITDTEKTPSSYGTVEVTVKAA